MLKFSAVSGVLLLVLVNGATHGRQPDAAAQPAPGAEGERVATDEDLLKDFVHYVFIEQVAAAASMGQGLLDRNPDPVAFVKLVESSGGHRRFSDAIVRAQRHAALEPLAGRLFTLYETGKRATVRSPDAVEANIRLLTGDASARLLGRDRLRDAREYAMPQLLQALLQGQDGRLRGEVRQLMVEMGRDAVIPLATALPKLEPAMQEMVADILGDIGYPAAVPFLFELRANTTVEPTRAAAENAARKIVGVVNDAVPLADRFVDLAENYYAESPSLTIFPGESHQLLWSYNPAIGLVMNAIETPVFHEAMAMQLCERALRIDAANARAVPLWLASNFSRETDSPKDPAFVNVAYGPERRDAMYYAVAAGPGPAQHVLARGLDTSDTPLIRQSLAALEKTAGGAGLWGAGSQASTERRPLLDALRYPSRRVQYEAALALGAAGPREAFSGSDQVVRILGSAIRDAAAKYALVVTNDAERSSTLADVLRGRGYTVLPPAARLIEAEQSIADAPGVDIIVVQLPSAQTADLIDQAQANNKLRATPILALVSAQGYADQASRYIRDQRVRIARDGITGPETAEAVRQLVERATGGDIAPEEAEAYRMRALSVLRDLAVSGNTVLNVADAGGPLVTALGDASGDLKRRICEVLSYVNTRSAQQALADAAIAATGEEQVSLLATCAGSAKRFGNQLEPRHIDAIKELAASGGADAATAAAALMGSLNLPNADLVPMILGESE